VSPARRALPVALATAGVVGLLAAVRPRPAALPTAEPLTTTATLRGVSRRPAPTPGRVRSGLSAPQTTPFSYLQVRVTFTGRTLTRVETVELTGSGARTQAINARAEPILRAEALRAGDGHVDIVTGATYTSRAYEAAVRSAIHQARRR
jgi:uncharacterized protein with FMN-binding domain